MAQAYIIDFHDSFVYNIAAKLHQLNISTEVICFEELEDNLDQLKSEFPKLIVWGPGPKHPYAYKKIFPFITELRNLKQNYHMGICLGHQILMTLEGYKIKPAKQILHGQNVAINIPDWIATSIETDKMFSTQVQRYNSLAVEDRDSDHLKCLSIDDEVMITGYPNGVSYQFHPESIGTYFPNLFFQSSVDFLYNRYDERSTQNIRYL
jgi:anthranilate/para-aminobenzoate synthase component II